jgi:hypothetical protein
MQNQIRRKQTGVRDRPGYSSNHLQVDTFCCINRAIKSALLTVKYRTIYIALCGVCCVFIRPVTTGGWEKLGAPCGVADTTLRLYECLPAISDSNTDVINSKGRFTEV